MYLPKDQPFNLNGYSCVKKSPCIGLQNYPCVYQFTTQRKIIDHWPNIVSILQSTDYQNNNSIQISNVNGSSVSMHQGWASLIYQSLTIQKGDVKPYYVFFDAKMKTTYSIAVICQNLLLVSTVTHDSVMMNECGEVETPKGISGFTKLSKQFKFLFEYSLEFAMIV